MPFHSSRVVHVSVCLYSIRKLTDNTGFSDLIHVLFEPINCFFIFISSGCHVSLEAFASDDRIKGGSIRLNDNLLYKSTIHTDGIILMTVDTTPRMCTNRPPVIFHTNLEPNTSYAMIDYINNVTDGMWIVGISCGSVSIYLAPAYEYFSKVLGVDLSILASDGKITFIARKGDPFAAEQRDHIGFRKHIFMEADLTVGHGNSLELIDIPLLLLLIILL